ncbi:DNA primase [Vibrio phage D485]
MFNVRETRVIMFTRGYIMQILIDIQYAKMLQHRLLLPKVHSNRPFKINARCPVCGDSKKNKYKTRFWINEVKTKAGEVHLRCSCWNCDLNVSLFQFLKDHEPSLFSQYRVDLFKERNSRERKERPPEPVKENAANAAPVVVEKEQEEQLFHNITALKEGHVLHKYLDSRKIPHDKWHLLGFTRGWSQMAKTLRPDLYEGEIRQDHPRLVIPIYNKDGLVAVQGRALTNKHAQRYMTIKIDDDFNKIYGTERINEDDDVIFVEGPIDSLFLYNCCAIVGGQVSPQNAPYAGHRIWALDNEARHPDVVKRMQSLIKAGERVVIWDKLPPVIAGKKDINDFVKAGVNAEFIQQYIYDNAVSGLIATNRLNRWKKI